MQNLLDNLKLLLQKDERLISEGELLKNKIIELALKLDKELIKLLLSDKKMKEVFFVNVDGTLIFDKDKFIKFVSNKQFLPDSYTTFKNKIGLTVDDEFVSEKKEVVLSWPYKDCVLEGGMTKEDQKRDEIFWNEILAPDEISRLLDPKVFTNAKRIDKNGEHLILSLRGAERRSNLIFKTDEKGDIKDNLIIKGNNLLALHSLKKRFAGKVKLIYIDPPYYFHENKSEDTFNYNTNFKLSSWCVFMKNRLEVAKDLLSKDGAIFIQIDDDGLPYLKVILDELLGIENCITTIAVKVTSESGVKVSANKPVRVKETILCYSKSSDWKYNRQFVIDGTYDPNYSYFVENPEDEPTRWKIVNIKDKFLEITKNKKISEEDLYNFQIKYKNNIFSVRDISKELKEKYFSKNKNRFIVLKKENKSTILWKNGEIIFFANKVRTINNKEFSVKYLSDIWIDISWDGIAKEGGVTLKKGKKPERLLERIINMSTNRGDIVMDFFAGTGTTCAVAHKMGRQYIGVEQLDYGENSAVVRLKNVINGDQTGISKSVDWKGGEDFVYLEFMKWNESFVEKIKKAKTKDELKKLWEIVKEKAFLSYKVDVKAIGEYAKDFEDLFIEDQKRFLLECLDKNHLYVNYSEIDDEDYGVSEGDKKFNREFYKF